MVTSIKNIFQEYPRQFWLMFFGMLISALGGSMVWPFLMIYLSEKLDAPLTIAASLLTLNSIAGLIASLLAGPVIDRLGRKWIMVASLVFNGISFYFLGNASTWPVFIFLMVFNGVSQPLYRTAGDAMLADLLPPEKRMDGYSLLRMSNNAGIAIGPAVGGFLATVSYSLAFSGAAVGMGIYAALLAIFAIETLPKIILQDRPESQGRDALGGYLPVLRDRPFMSVAITYTMAVTVFSLLWVLLPVYAKQNYQIPENQYGWIPTTNAVMCVVLQVGITKITKRFRTLPVLASGAFFYSLAVFWVALSGSFWQFWVSMVILTIGELVLVPTASTYVANLAHPAMRGRYMSIFGLAWRVAIGVGPLLGGVLNDALSPKAIWYGGALLGLASSLIFLLLQVQKGHREETTVR